MLGCERTKVNGVFKSEYIAARKALLDALEAFGSQREALILVGAQAIYFWTGSAELAVAEYTTDADLAIDPRVLHLHPDLAVAMREAGFYLDGPSGNRAVGVWSSVQMIEGESAIVKVDLLVPEALGGAGRRAARLGPDHEKGAALKVHGLEAALVDKTSAHIASLDEVDKRSFDMALAGPAALLVAKVHKLNQRVDESEQGRVRRLKDKDALDILRLLRVADLGAMAGRLRELEDDPLAGQVTREALDFMPGLFARPDSSGSLMAARAAFPEPEDVIALSCAVLAGELLKAVGR